MFYFALLFLLLIIVFGCVSISQAYASAKQAQASIEVSQTAQLALKGQALVSIALIVIVFILLIAIFALFYKFLKKQEGMLRLPYLPVNELLQKEDRGLGGSGVQQTPLINQEKEKFPILPHDWGW